MTNLLKNHINTGLIIMTKIIKIRLEVPSPNPSKSIVFEWVGPGFEFLGLLKSLRSSIFTFPFSKDLH